MGAVRTYGAWKNLNGQSMQRHVQEKPRIENYPGLKVFLRICTPKKALRYIPLIFSHPDYTVGSGITPDRLPAAVHGLFRINHSKSPSVGNLCRCISPCPEEFLIYLHCYCMHIGGICQQLFFSQQWDFSCSPEISSSFSRGILRVLDSASSSMSVTKRCPLSIR